MLKDLRDIEIKKPIVNEREFSDYRIPKALKNKLSQVLGPFGYGFDFYTSFSATDKRSIDKVSNDKIRKYALIPNQYFNYACEMYDFSTELFKYLSIFDKVRSFSKILIGNAVDIEKAIKSDQFIRSLFDDDNDITLFSKFIDNEDDKFRMGSKKLINKDGPRGAKDCFGSVILKEINLPDASSSVFGELVYDLCQNPDLYRSLFEHHKSMDVTLAIQSDKNDAKEFISLPKPFLLLAGISGTGKSRFVREQAKATGHIDKTYCLVSVRPDWHEPSDLLGYSSRLNGNVEYVITDVLTFIVKAWKAIAESGVQITGKITSGHRNDLQAIPPYWLCLDEMNLAPVEQYFADYLSILETREWEWEDDAFTYQCAPLLKASVIQSLSDDKRSELCERLELDPASALWLEFFENGIGIPFNLLVAGTVNMDETTHGFSRKVIDRALSFDFGDFFPNDFDDYFSPTIIPKKLSYPIYSHAAKSQSRLPKIDVDGKKSIAFLQSLNTVLDNTPFKLAYRALNELLLSVISHQPEDEIQLQAVWDDFLMCKLLPRIEGDSDKLAQHDIDESLLIKLSRILGTTLHDIWNEPTDLSSARPDFYREKQQGGATIIIACRSRAKIEWMQNKLAQSGFTSFWP
ncbi:McrB family protein [Pectobacterium brasiliense]|uniref:McrB family protein n=1 Tax=Pectobacterium brasiliense TaxID=180957 RepID=UPI000A441DB1|nr:AAA family ATPase [Pectobacterium brasiliense]